MKILILVLCLLVCGCNEKPIEDDESIFTFNDTQEGGVLYFNAIDNKLYFEGNMDESAKIFIDYVNKNFIFQNQK